jgi:DNA-binding CsgD family transcriptional regulator
MADPLRLPESAAPPSAGIAEAAAEAAEAAGGGAAGRPTPAASADLPAPLTSFVGRERVLAPVRARLLDPGARLVTLTGPDASGRGRSGRPVRRPFDLTEREAEVLGLLVRGASDAEIARRLIISVRTANRHVANILGKTGAPNRTAAAALALGHEPRPD